MIRCLFKGLFLNIYIFIFCKRNGIFLNVFSFQKTNPKTHLRSCQDLGTRGKGTSQEETPPFPCLRRTLTPPASSQGCS